MVVKKAYSKEDKVKKNYEKNNVRVKITSRKRLDTAIALYMRAQVQVTYGAKYRTELVVWNCDRSSSW